jgi:hypothetical protein
MVVGRADLKWNRSPNRIITFVVVPVLAAVMLLPAAGWMGILVIQQGANSTLNNKFILYASPRFDRCTADPCRLWFSATVAVDLGIAIGLLWVFSTWRSNSSYPSTINVLTKLSLRAVASGAITAAHATIVLIAYKARPVSTLGTGCALSLPQVYA